VEKMFEISKVKKFFFEIPKKEFIILFSFVIIPQLLRQIIYYTTFLQTNSTMFIDSFETKSIYNLGFPIIGFIEELFIGSIFIFLWFKTDKLHFLTYGWIADAFFDILSVFIFVLIGVTPLQIIFEDIKIRFGIREFLLPYFILGPILNKIKANPYLLSIITASLGLLFTIIIIILPK